MTIKKYLRILIIFLFLISTILIVDQINAQSQPCQQSVLNQGLISALSITGAIGSSDQTCVQDAQAAYRDFKVPSYFDLENQFYTLSKSTAKKTSELSGTNPDFNGNGIYLQKSSMVLGGATGTGVQIIFIRGNLDINGNIDYANSDPNSGLVLIASGNINIGNSVTQVNAVLISYGTICTAMNYSNGICSDPKTTTNPQLVINGSLLSLNKNQLPASSPALRLARNLATNNQPAEIINKQPKFLYILRNNLFTQDLTLIQEDQNYTITTQATPTPVPTPVPTPTPTPTPCPGTGNPLVITANQSIDNCIISI